MTAEYQVQKAGVNGQNWKTVCRGPETTAREVFLKQLRLYSVGRFRLVDPCGKIVDEQNARPLFSGN